VIFAGGIVTMLVAAFVVIVFEHVTAIYDRRRLLGLLFCAASVVALAGPLAATIGSWLPSRARKDSGKSPKPTGLEEL
jgi:hypothetical protein